MRVKMLRSVGRNLPDLVPEGEKGDKAIAASLLPLGLVEGGFYDLDSKQVEFLKKHLLAEEVGDVGRDAARSGIERAAPASASSDVSQAQGLAPSQGGRPRQAQKAAETSTEQHQTQNPTSPAELARKAAEAKEKGT